MTAEPADNVETSTPFQKRPRLRARWLLPASTIGLVLVVWVVAGQFHEFRYGGEPQTEAAVQALATDGWEVDRINPAEGIELLGLIRRPKEGVKRWILLLPGNARFILEGHRKFLDPIYDAHGVGIAIWPWRGFDASSGVPSPEGLAQDASVAWARMTQLGIEPENIEVWGYSLGTGVGMELVGLLSRVDEAPSRLVLLSPYEQIGIMPPGLFGRFEGSHVYDGRAAIPKIQCPVVIVHGLEDHDIPIEVSRRLSEQLGERARLIELPGKGHIDYLEDLSTILF